MADIKRVRCTWEGAGVVGPSVSTFYFTSGASGFPADLQAFFQAIKSGLPDDVVITVPNTGDIISDANGVLTGVWTDSGGSTTNGTDTGTFAKGNGVRIQWVTAGLRDGRRVIGSTFIVPVVQSVFNTGGIVASTALSTFQTAASALVTAVAPDMVIFSKPHSKAAADGESNAVLAGVARSNPTQLRSRRV